MEKIFSNKTLIAIRIKKLTRGITSPTNPSDPLQIVTHKRLAGQETKAHTHIPKKRIATKLQECLVVLKGKIKIDLFGLDKKHFRSVYLSPGEAIIFIDGGHGVHVVKDCEIIEIKNGPFIEDKFLI